MTEDHRKSQLRRFGWLLHAAGFALLAVGALLVSQWILSPMRDSAAQDTNRIETLTRLLADAGRIHAEHANLSEQLAELERRAADIRQRVPEHPTEADFLKEITKAAKAEGLVIRDYRRGVLKIEATHSQLEVLLVGEGGYSSICKFVDQVAGLGRIAKIKRLHVERDGVGAVYPIEMTFVLYFGLKPNVTKG